MFNEVKTYCNEINEILQELESYENYKEQLKKNLSGLERQYQKGSYNYKQYIALKNRILGERTKDDLILYYNAYILTLLKKIEFVNAQIFSEIYGEEPKTGTLSKEISEVVMPKIKVPEGDISESEVSKVKLPKGKEKLIKIPFFAKTKELKPKEIESVPEPEVAPKIAIKEKILEPKIEVSETDKIGIPKPLPKRKLKIPKPTPRFTFLGKKKKTLFEEILEKEEVKPEKVGLGGILNLDLIKNMRKRMRERTKFIGEKTEVTPSILKLRKKAEGELNIEAPTLMAEQAEKIRNILLKKKIKIYTPSSLGFLANMIVRRIVLALMEHFPDFFKQLYLNLRYANIKILSNTYVNIMFFISILTFLVSFPLSLVFFSFQKAPFLINFTKASLFSLILTSLCFAFFYIAPTFRIKKRSRSINTNLPFAIDHMASVVTSGVPPDTMFKLIAESKEYGEVSKEVEKISNYIEVFGYDLLTAIRSVAITTPNKQLKEFFDGLVSTIESGGDLKSYLNQKSKEALLSYRLERQKYVESISTYSDIYTGVLIAAPLFFVSTLTLVSMLGGTIGGFGVSTVIAVGTYIVIPVLNVLFLIFLEVNQPQI